MVTFVIFEYPLSRPLHHSGPVLCIDRSRLYIAVGAIGAIVRLCHQTRFIPRGASAGFPLQPALVTELGVTDTGFQHVSI